MVLVVRVVVRVAVVRVAVVRVAVRVTAPRVAVKEVLMEVEVKVAVWAALGVVRVVEAREAAMGAA